jgi:hypothetical protein
MQLPGTRPDEHFFYSAWVPRPWVLINLGFVKFSWWGPWPFLSLALGWLGGQGPKVRALQLYLGIKLDGTQSHLYGKSVMVLTLKELAAVRIHDVDVNCDPYNMGGS